jgi:3-methyladenine DNA glycosylase AlkD
MGDLAAELRRFADDRKAADLQWFFKTGPGEYGEGDVFLGVRVPAIRAVARRHQDLPLDCSVHLLQSPVHEERLLALCILVRQYGFGNEALRRRIYRIYLENTRHVNNWDLVDSSAPQIVGFHLYKRSRAPLFRLAKSSSMWERRIAVMSTFYFVRQMDFADTIALADLLLKDREDLIHKAAGWMIREIGNRDMAVAEAFLQDRHRIMPRIMLRYAIEKFPQDKRRRLMSKS